MVTVQYNMIWYIVVFALLHCLQSLADARDYSDHDGSNGVHLPSQYEQYCCAENNRGKSFMLKDGQQRIKFFLCPLEAPSSCSSIAASCSDILAHYPSDTSGYYNITLTNGSTITVYCDMEGVNCDGEGGWTRVAYLNMTDPSEQCPPGFRLYEVNGIRACGKQSENNAECQSVIYSSYNISYTKVCGRVIGYQQGSPDAIRPTGPRGEINRAYIDGISITRGSPRKHIWSFMAAVQENSFYQHGYFVCPCAPESPLTLQSFVGNDYFCESGNPVAWDQHTFHTDPLWDGKQCGLIEKECCNAPEIPWFNKILEQPTTDYIELRVCCDQPVYDEDSPVGFFEIYVK